MTNKQPLYSDFGVGLSLHLRDTQFPDLPLYSALQLFVSHAQNVSNFSVYW